VITPKSPIGNVGPRGLARADKDGGFTGLHTLRDRLPGDIQLETARTLADLQKLLGPTQGFRSAASEDGETRERVSWSAVTLNGDKSLDALQVNALVEKRARPNDAHIHSLEILRGNASPELKSPRTRRKRNRRTAGPTTRKRLTRSPSTKMRRMKRRRRRISPSPDASQSRQRSY
jgi:hypothetical protein